MPVGMDKPQAIVIGSKVYVGGGATDHENVEVLNQVFQYDTSRDEWSRLPPWKVIFFAMAQFAGNLITVGGRIRTDGLTGKVQQHRKEIPDDGVTGKVYRFKKKSKKWEEFLKPMPTARFRLSVATTQSAIVASGGATGISDNKAVSCDTVEVYSSETSQWHTADPLPVPCGSTTSVTIADTWYLLGGGGTGGKSITTVQYAPLTTLIQKATSPILKSVSPTSVWKTLPDTPLMWSTAASLSGNLLAVGGWDDNTPAFPAVYVFLPVTDSWVRVTIGELPEPCYACTAVQLSSNQLLIVGGKDELRKRIKTAFLGSITI